MSVYYNENKIAGNILLDSAPTQNSQRSVMSGGVYTALNNQVKANPTLAGTESMLAGLEVAGTKYKIPADESANILATQQMIAPILSDPAGQAVTAGQQVIYNNVLYKATAAIAANEAASSFTSKLSTMPNGGFNSIFTGLTYSTEGLAISSSSVAQYTTIKGGYFIIGDLVFFNITFEYGEGAPSSTVTYKCTGLPRVATSLQNTKIGSVVMPNIDDAYSFYTLMDDDVNGTYLSLRTMNSGRCSCAFGCYLKA